MAKSEQKPVSSPGYPLGLIEGAAVELYMRWARQEPVEQEYAMGMEP